MATAMRAIAATLLAGLVAAAPGPANAERPPAGRDLDERRTVALPAAVDAPCVAVRATGATVLLARRGLERLAAATPPTWKSEAEREALIAGRRARTLLDRAAAAVARLHGCAAVDAAALRDDLHLVADRLEAGDAAVVADGGTAPDRAIVVRYLGRRAGPASGFGEIQFLREGATTPFLRVEWWRA